MSNALIAILFAYCLIEILITIIGLSMYMDFRNNVDWTPVLFPSEWHREYKLNWFGATFATVGGFIFAPIVYFARILSWLCHVGRK